MHDPDAMMQSTEKEDSARKNSKENQRIGTRSVLTSLKLRKSPLSSSGRFKRKTAQPSF
jgi:hypothetical protein